MTKYLIFPLLFLVQHHLFAQQKGDAVLGLFVSSKQDSVPYQLVKPAGIDTSQSYPLVLWLHGKGERGSDNKKQMTLIKKWLIDSLQKSNRQAYLLAPQCSEDRYWNPYDKLAEKITFDTVTPEIQQSLLELIKKVKLENKIDTSRIYIIGVSMGGFGVFDMITRFPHLFAAAIPVCGGADPLKSDELSLTPVWAFHGGKDNIVDIRHSQVPMGLIADSNHIFTIYHEKGHDAWNKAFKENNLLNWLFSYKKKN